MKLCNYRVLLPHIPSERFLSSLNLLQPQPLVSAVGLQKVEHRVSGSRLSVPEILEADSGSYHDAREPNKA